jgi:glycosyltransferase involved in cell wall biosynthesis
LRVLLLHPNFPGQFRQLAPALKAAGHDVVGVGARAQPWAETGVAYRCCGGDPHTDLRHGNPEMRLTAQLAHGRRVAGILSRLAAEGWCPDVVLVHPFWGDVLFLDDVFPGVPLLALLEIDFQGLALDRFDPEFGYTAAGDFGANLALRQWADQMAIRRMQQGVTATGFQRSTFPRWQQARIEVIHEGVDLRRCRPDPLARFSLASGLTLKVGDPVVSFGSRSLEPLRGLASFMRCLPLLLQRHSSLQVVVVGQDGHSYGPPPPAGAASWKELLQRELGDRVDWRRVHFTGHLAYEHLLRLFQITQAHVYLTYPYVLSWSLLEAMACGATVVGSATAPVQEVIEHGANGWLVPFFEPEALADQLLAVLADPCQQQPIRLAARQTVAQRFEMTACTARMTELLRQVSLQRVS